MSRSAAPHAGVVWTVGHSSRTLAELVALLRGHGLTSVVDIRRFPRSRRHPRFDLDVLARELSTAGLAYAHAAALGGFRYPVPHSLNTGLRSRAFQGYADHMHTPDFAHHLATLITTATMTPTAIMCAESAPQHCHRALLADTLIAHGLEVRHIVDHDPPRLHTLTRGAHVDSGRVTYPGQIELFGT